LDLSFAKRVSVPENVMVRQLEGESVILNLDTERYFGLDEMGTHMLTALTSSDSIQTACDALLEEYEVEPDLLRRDLGGLVGKLVEQGLVTIDD
jgi:hypothetical protein